MSHEWTPKPQLPSPVRSSGVLGWLRENLFSSVGNSLLTVIGLALLVSAIVPFVQWALLDASWVGESRQICDDAVANGKLGACWVFINVRMDVFLYGFYPEAEYWRVNLTMLVLAFLLLPILLPDFFKGNSRRPIYGLVGLVAVGILFGLVPMAVFGIFAVLPLALGWLSKQGSIPFVSANGVPAVLTRLGLAALVGAAGYHVCGLSGGADVASYVGWVTGVVCLAFLQIRSLSVAGWQWVFLFTVFPVFAFIMLVGGAFGLAHVETHYWGGLFLTLVVAGTGMGTALPIGILLALGRRSDLPVIRVVCVSFIEFARGVPLVSVLFMASVMFPLFLPENVTFDKLLRALIGIAFFYAAYMAEVVRGGLQAIPAGQYEAAKALGWPYWRMMSMVILPQTLRLVIPGLANNFLSLLKDTTLVAVIGLFDLLGIAKAAMADSDWLGYTKESYIFAALVFWIFCFGISRYCVYLEKKYHTSYH